jgi:hypothetical protein
MSEQYNNELTFRLFKNDKGDNPKRPDYRGEAEIGGVHYWLSGWISEVKSGQRAGTKYIRGKVERKEAVPPRPPQPQPSHTDTEDVPF